MFFQRILNGNRKIKIKSTLVVLVLPLLFCSGCKNIDTYAHSKYFLQNQSDPVEISTTYDTPLENLTQAVLPAVVAIVCKVGSTTTIGSGVCVYSGGYVLTNEHVISGASEITLYQYSGTSGLAIVLWKDLVQDLALLKSELAIPYVEMGSSLSAVAGQEILAIGTPLSLNFTHTCTKGIVSAVNRTLPVTTSDGSGYMQDLLQHDAGLNAGNSGGPLLNMQGQVIGINTLKISSAEGLGFAIPIDSVKVLVENLVQDYLYTTPYLGVCGYSLSGIKTVNNPVNTGFYVESVDESSPAAAWLQPGDILTTLNGQTLAGAADLKTKLYGLEIGQGVTLGVTRGEKSFSYQIHLVAHPSHETARVGLN